MTRWHEDNLPIDVWALDMNWRNSKTAHGNDFVPCKNTGLPGPNDNCTSQDHYYDYPDSTRFPDLGGPYKRQSFIHRGIHSDSCGVATCLASCVWHVAELVLKTCTDH